MLNSKEVHGGRFMPKMKQSWRWFGENDPVTLRDARQAGATDIVSACHHIPNGEIWPIDQIQRRQLEIQNAGMKWTVVESVPIHEDIKKRTGHYKKYISNYQQTIKNLAKCGIHIVCYNFMPLLDWTRTDLSYPLSDCSKALYFDEVNLAVFDLFLLERSEAESDYAPNILDQAEKSFKTMGEGEKKNLVNNILAGLPGSEEGYTLDQFKSSLSDYRFVGRKELQENIIYFLDCLLPVCEEVSVKMAIHPDDPPFDILGLPRAVSTLTDLEIIFQKQSTRENGLTFCTGSLGASEENNLSEIFNRFSDRVHFIHLRNIKKTSGRSFYEANHLEGDVNMFQVVRLILEEQKRRAVLKYEDSSIPMRPDHGHQLMDDLRKVTNPGYSGIGRLKGLAELRGLELGIHSMI